jgi:hypothetical protein
MWIFPLGAALVSATFAFLLGRQWIARRRPYTLAWTVALAMFMVATLATAQGVRLGWTPGLFRAYYLFGAMVNVPFLAVGTVELLSKRRWVGHGFAALVLVAAAYGAAAMARAHLDAAVLDGVRGIPEARFVITGTALTRTLSRYYSYTSFTIVVLGALFSALRLSRQRSGPNAAHLRRLATGNLLIAAGTFVVAAASIAVRLGRGSEVAMLFSVGLLAGVSLMFAGFLRTRPRPVLTGAGRAIPTPDPVRAPVRGET